VPGNDLAVERVAGRNHVYSSQEGKGSNQRHHYEVPCTLTMSEVVLRSTEKLLRRFRHGMAVLYDGDKKFETDLEAGYRGERDDETARVEPQVRRSGSKSRSATRSPPPRSFFARTTAVRCCGAGIDFDAAAS